MISRPRSPRSRPLFSLRRHLATGVLILSVAALPLASQRQAPAQRGGAPRADTPQLIVSVLASKEPAIGRAAADAIRERIQNEHVATELYVVPRPTIVRTLVASGYNPDSVLGTTDLMELARNVRGDYALTGTVERTPSGVRTSVRLLTRTDSRIVAEPLPPIDGTNLGDIAKQVDRAVSEAIRALAFYHDCTNAVRAGDYAKAMTAAQQGLKLRPASASLNLCVLSILYATKASPDSIIRVAMAVTAADSTSTTAWLHLVAAYDQKGDSVRALDALRVLHRIDPTDIEQTLRLVGHSVAAGQVDSAVAVLDAALRVSPEHADLLRAQWLLDLHRGQYAAALEHGAALIRADSAAATPDYYERQLAAARGARDSVSAHRIAIEASARFAQNATFLVVLAHDTLDRGAAREALGLVQRAMAIEPANQLAWQLAITAHAKSDGIDSAVATARRGLAAGVPSDVIGSSLAGVVGAELAVAQTSTKRDDWETVLRAAQAADSVAPSQRNYFYLGVAAFQIVSDEAQSLVPIAKKRSPTRAERQAACGSSKRAEDLVATATIAITKGGSVEPATASRILNALPDYSQFVSSVKRASCP